MPASPGQLRLWGGESRRSCRSPTDNGSGSGNAVGLFCVPGSGIGQAVAGAGHLAQAPERAGMAERVVEGVVRAPARRPRCPVGLEGRMPWAALDAHRERLEVEAGVPRRGVVEESPLVPVDPHGVEPGGGGDEH